MTQDTSSADAIWVTQEAYERLQEELNHLRGEVRANITAKIAQARDQLLESLQTGLQSAAEGDLWR